MNSTANAVAIETKPPEAGTTMNQTMTAHNLFSYPYASFTNAQLPLLKVAVLWFDKLVILDPVGASGTPSAQTKLPVTP